MTEFLGAYPSAQHTEPVDSATPFTHNVSHQPALLRPRPLAEGDTIGVIAPSYAPQGSWLRRGVRALEEAGFKVTLDSDIERFRRFQKAEDQRRAEHLMEMWQRPEVRAIICGTGGYGAVRLLPYLDPEVFRRDPKPFVGYSDITALHLWLMRRAQVRVF